MTIPPKTFWHSFKTPHKMFGSSSTLFNKKETFQLQVPTAAGREETPSHHQQKKI